MKSFSRSTPALRLSPPSRQPSVRKFAKTLEHRIGGRGPVKGYSRRVSASVRAFRNALNALRNALRGDFFVTRFAEIFALRQVDMLLGLMVTFDQRAAVESAPAGDGRQAGRAEERLNF